MNTDTKNTSSKSDEWDQGAIAHDLGHDRTENPYKHGTRAHRRWNNGWLDMEEASFGGYRDDE